MIYYAHHMWKYNTEEEKREINLIWNRFQELIINPNGWIAQNNTEEAIMNQCFHFVRMCDITVFSTIDGVMGKGVYTEVKEALDNNKEVYYLNDNNIESFTIENFKKIKIIYDQSKTNRLFAKIN